MNEAFAELADAYLEGALDEQQAERLLAYLRDSPAATEHLQALAAIDAGLRQIVGPRRDALACRRGVLARIHALGRERPLRAAVERRIAESLRTPRRGARAQRRRRFAPGARWLAGASLAAGIIAALSLLMPSRTVPPAHLGDAPTPALIESAQGWVTVERGERTETMVTGSALLAGDLLATGEDAEAAIRLADGTLLRLARAGLLRIAAPDGARARLERGELSAEVSPQAPDAPAVLSTPGASIRVLGTAFAVAVKGGATDLRVTKGVVALHGDDGRDWRVAAGESLRLVADRTERTVALPVRRRPGDPWHQAAARTLQGLVDYTPGQAPPLDRWAGRSDRSLSTNGGFRVERDAGRWWAVDPEGHPLLLLGVSNLHPALRAADPGLAAMGGMAGWADATTALLGGHGFNVLGTSSDTTPLAASLAKHGQHATTVVEAAIADRFATAYLRQHTALGDSAETHDCIQGLAPLLPGFAAYLSAWERERTNGDAVAACVTDLNRFTADWGVLRHLAERDADIRRALSERLAARDRDLGKAGAADLAALRHDCMAAYRDLVYPAVRRTLPHALLLGQVLGLSALADRDVVATLVSGVDAVPIHLIGQFPEDSAPLTRAYESCHRPLWVHGFYAKAADSGLPNQNGVGLEVPSQAERARFYQHVTLALLESRVVIGWQWFRYQDAGEGTLRSLADCNSNKGIVDAHMRPYTTLLDAMAELNRNAYGLIDYFDRRAAAAP